MSPLLYCFSLPTYTCFVSFALTSVTVQNATPLPIWVDVLIVVLLFVALVLCALTKKWEEEAAIRSLSEGYSTISNDYAIAQARVAVARARAAVARDSTMLTP